MVGKTKILSNLFSENLTLHPNKKHYSDLVKVVTDKSQNLLDA